MMSFICQEGSKRGFSRFAPLIQPLKSWNAIVEPFAGSAVVGLTFAEIYPERGLVIGDVDHTIVECFRQVAEGPTEMQEWAWRYAELLKHDEATRELWRLYTASRDNPQAFTAPQRAALRFHAGHICSLPALNKLYRPGGYSPQRAGHGEAKQQWLTAHPYEIEKLDEWHEMLSKAEVYLEDFRETIRLAANSFDRLFCFIDSPYRRAKNDKAKASPRYYGRPFNVDDLGPQCSEMNAQGHFVIVTLDWHPENSSMFDGDWTIWRARWKSYGETFSSHLVAINYEPMFPVDETTLITGWDLVQERNVQAVAA